LAKRLKQKAIYPERILSSTCAVEGEANAETVLKELGLADSADESPQKNFINASA